MKQAERTLVLRRESTPAGRASERGSLERVAVRGGHDRVDFSTDNNKAVADLLVVAAL